MTSPSTSASAARAVGAVRLVDLRSTAFGAEEVMAAVEDPHAGGTSVFVGRVRDHDHDREVTLLEYSAHPSALDRLRDVAAHVAGSHDVVAVAAVHRLGTLEVGDVTVALAVSAAHRGEAYTASRDLIDTLKREVPIWKHQVFSDGADEWVNCP